MYELLFLFQQKVRVIFLTNGWRYWETFEMVSQLLEEKGEVAREAHFLYGSKKKRKGEKDGDIEEEIGDVLLALACFSNSKGYYLSIAFQKGTSGRCEYMQTDPLILVAELASRVGSFCDEVIGQYEIEGEDGLISNEHIEIRIGNILRTLDHLAERVGCTFEGAMQKNINKTTVTDKGRFPDGV
ncbi:MAG: MazG family protein [Candidatus Wolfebacteria bacterium GW2011_GWC2_39_22]|uniref:MazG family protein n=1 Tax=Candidatus Wolfebacteria bacterium GW2011_GWC2_39_22 TaxID=1619013 RepID=A0A0G0N8J5_9BACT|nr:MAG: MazG family protein [Candidatus Wolfebacteria bacterium GW2011_GWC2_39_22]HBI25713.1 hypothetical protein [Candidatus Wolfebacteria bacterium]